MTFWQQLNLLLSEAPGNIVYHLVTLFALQATLAIALSHWLRSRREHQEDVLARRLAIAAGGIFFTRLLLLAASLLAGTVEDPTLPLRALPPLEMAIQSVTVLLVVWALLPRPGTVALALSILAMAILYGLAAQDWAQQPQDVLAGYLTSAQAIAWGVLQLSLLVAGTVYLVARRAPATALRLMPVLVLLLAHGAQLLAAPSPIPGGTVVPIWQRLGNLVALPMLAVLAYRNSLRALLATRFSARPAVEQVVRSLELASAVIESPTLEATIRQGIGMVRGATAAPFGAGVPFAAVALIDPDSPGHLDLSARLSGSDQVRQWRLQRDDWAAFGLAMKLGETVELLPDGLGARQLHDFYGELGVETGGPLLVEALQIDDRPLGVLMVGAPSGWEQWPADPRALLPPLAAYLARAVHNARVGARSEQPVIPAETQETTGHMIAMEQARDRALEQAQQARDQLQQTEERLAAAEEQARDLAATIGILEERGDPDQQLEAEVAALRDSLREAEEALALAAAAESELTAEWVTTTVSRYSAELERAEARVAVLEQELGRREPERAQEVLVGMVQELRTPLTSISGYTDIMLAETMGILGSKQRDFLQRVKANVERMGLLLDQIVQLAVTPPPAAKVQDIESVPVEEIIDTAVNMVIGQVRKKSLQLNLEIADAIPPLQANRDALSQVLIHLLSNASLASESEGELTISAHTNVAGVNGEPGASQFVHLAVRDSGGGIRPEDRPHVFDPQYRADHPLISGLGDTGAGLSVVQALVNAHGGRVWVDSEVGAGSTFSVLLPLTANGRSAANGA